MSFLCLAAASAAVVGGGCVSVKCKLLSPFMRMRFHLPVLRLRLYALAVCCKCVSALWTVSADFHMGTASSA